MDILFAKTKTVSFVEASLSTEILLKDNPTASLRAFFKVAAFMFASVAKKESMVAMSGHIMPAPFAMPRILVLEPPMFFEP